MNSVPHQEFSKFPTEWETLHGFDRRWIVDSKWFIFWKCRYCKSRMWALFFQDRVIVKGANGKVYTHLENPHWVGFGCPQCGYRS